MVRIWIALLHQEKPEHKSVLVFLFRCGREDENRAAVRSTVNNSPVGCRLARGSQLVGTSNKRLRSKAGRIRTARPCASRAANSPVGCCLARGSQLVGTSNKRLRSKAGRIRTARPCASRAANSPVGCCLARGSQLVGMSDKMPLLCGRESPNHQFIILQAILQKLRLPL